MNTIDLKIPCDSKEALRLEVLKSLKSGKDKALSGKVLAEILGERDTRQIRLAINELIEQGYPICGTAKPPYGYYIAENAEECKECLDQLKHYLKMLGKHHRDLMRASENLLHPQQSKMRL